MSISFSTFDFYSQETSNTFKECSRKTLNRYTYQEITYIYLQDNLFGVVDIVFTSNEGYHRFDI